jgi:hypothetical protein
MDALRALIFKFLFLFSLGFLETSADQIYLDPSINTTLVWMDGEPLNKNDYLNCIS